MRVGFGRGRQERTFQVEGIACTEVYVREKVSTFEKWKKALVSKMERSGNGGWRKGQDRLFRTLHVSGGSFSAVAHYSLLESHWTQSLFLRVLYFLSKLFQRGVICFHWSPCFHSGAADLLRKTGDFSLCIHVYKWRLGLFSPNSCWRGCSAHCPLFTCHSVSPHSCNRQNLCGHMTSPGQQ